MWEGMGGGGSVPADVSVKGLPQTDGSIEAHRGRTICFISPSRRSLVLHSIYQPCWFEAGGRCVFPILVKWAGEGGGKSGGLEALPWRYPNSVF